MRAPPLVGRASGVVEVCAPAARLELGGHLLCLVACVAVDDCGAAPTRWQRSLQQLQQPRVAAVGGDDLGAQGEVLTPHIASHHRVRRQLQARADGDDGARGGGGGEAEHGVDP